MIFIEWRSQDLEGGNMGKRINGMLIDKNFLYHDTDSLSNFY